MLYAELYIIVTGFLELINNMLTSGMVPALYPDDEKEQIIGQVCNIIITIGSTKIIVALKDTIKNILCILIGMIRKLFQ